MLSLRPRLKAAADMVRPHRKTVDVGTDHAYLPAFLVLNGITEKVLVCDIGSRPLENARKTLEIYRLCEKIELRVSNGLEEVRPNEAEEITICGMGGTLIADILCAAPWIKNERVHLVLQPMTHSEDVRKYLCENGFTIDKELCLIDNSRVYCCISAYWDGHSKDFSPGYYYFGELLNAGAAADTYINKQIARVKKRAQALSKAQRFPEEKQMLISVIEYYESRKEK